MVENRIDFRDPDWVAKQLGIDKNAVYRFLDEGRLPGLRLGRKWLISESTLVEQLKREEREQTRHRRLVSLQGSALTEAQARELPFTANARRAIELALAESAERRHDYIGQEHILFAFGRLPACTAARVLSQLGLDPCAAVDEILTPGDFPAAAERGLTPRALEVLKRAHEESQRRGDADLGTEHLLLGMVRVGFELLRDQGVTVEQIDRALGSLDPTGARGSLGETAPADG